MKVLSTYNPGMSTDEKPKKHGKIKKKSQTFAEKSPGVEKTTKRKLFKWSSMKKLKKNSPPSLPTSPPPEQREPSAEVVDEADGFVVVNAAGEDVDRTTTNGDYSHQHEEAASRTVWYNKA